ncbi:hypothetical protein Vadar_023138 [Vaccinium darrowii]|uniref:Uncharacterized protein n=1 Tax=Vaccinium darrowii TaxID=229202 RepID=A0ACB7Y135_9ERIC|nr:hypothetical protein Vadar_023138 [Vaccinium darrowii]
MPSCYWEKLQVYQQDFHFYFSYYWECLKRCMDLVKKGTSVFFFPEGTRSKDGKLGTFKKGAFSVAAKTKVPVVPITIIGTDQGNTRLYDILRQFPSRNRVPILVWQQASFHIGVMTI